MSSINCVLLNNSFVSNIYVGSDGKLHKVQGGADSVLPFSSIKRYSYNWTSSNNEQKTLTLEIEPKYIAFTVGGNKQNAVLYDVEKQEYIINTTGANIIVSVNGKVVTIINLDEDNISSVKKIIEKDYYGEA